MRPSTERVAVLVAVSSLLAVSVSAQDLAGSEINEESISLTNIGPTVSPREIAPPLPIPGGDGGVDLGSIVNTASKIWAIIEKGKPVVDVRNQYATALPLGAKHWAQLDSWKKPVGTLYRLTAKNGYGITVIDVRYQVLRTTGGRYKGKGRYLTAVSIEPTDVKVAWGYNFSLSAEVPESSVVNVGTVESPVAAMTATVKWRIQTTLKDVQGKGLYYLQGDGEYKELSGPFQNARVENVRKILDALPVLN